MAFTEKKFKKLSEKNKTKKLVYTIKMYLEGKTSLEYLTNLFNWYKIDKNLDLFLPENNYAWGILYQELLKETNNEMLYYKENCLFDKPGKNKNTMNLSVILDNIRSPFNVGSIIRSSEAFGIEKVVMCGISPGPENNEKVLKTSMNADINCFHASSTLDYLKELKNNGINIYAIEKTVNSLPINKCSVKTPGCLIFGNEEFGISEDVLNICDNIFHIPMLGNKNSINVSVAAGIVLFELSQNYNGL